MPVDAVLLSQFAVPALLGCQSVMCTVTDDKLGQAQKMPFMELEKFMFSAIISGPDESALHHANI